MVFKELTMDNSDNEMNETLITLTSDIVAAHVSNNNVTVEDVPTLISSIYGALAGLGKTAAAPEKMPRGGGQSNRRRTGPTSIASPPPQWARKSCPR